MEDVPPTKDTQGPAPPARGVVPPPRGEAGSAAQGGHLNFGMLNFSGTPRRLLMKDCCAMVSTLLVIQYSTRPAGKKKNMTENISGIIHISLACNGSGGSGLSAVWIMVVMAITSGRM